MPSPAATMTPGAAGVQVRDPTGGTTSMGLRRRIQVAHLVRDLIRCTTSATRGRLRCQRAACAVEGDRRPTSEELVEHVHRPLRARDLPEDRRAVEATRHEARAVDEADV